jgi:hypothetical protein
VEIKTIGAKYGLKLDEIVQEMAPPLQALGKAAKPAAKLGKNTPAKSVKLAKTVLPGISVRAL